VPYVTQLFQMLGSAVIPGSSQANMYFELYSGTALFQAAFMLSDLKLGQYTKLPPRITFTVQIIGTSVGALLNYVIMQSVVNNERTILLDNQGTRTWSGQQVQTYNANAVLWGALGKEIYGPSGPYFIVPMGIVIGLFLPIIPWFLYRRFQWGWLRQVNTAVLAYFLGGLAGGTNGYINTTSTCAGTTPASSARYVPHLVVVTPADSDSPLSITTSSAPPSTEEHRSSCSSSRSASGAREGTTFRSRIGR
jgi:hypothetical protein